MTEINSRTTARNPRGAGRKPKAPEDKKIKRTVSLSPAAVDKLVAAGDGVLSKGIEMQTMDQMVFNDAGTLVGLVHIGPGDKPFQAWTRQRAAVARGNVHTMLGRYKTLEAAIQAVRKAVGLKPALLR